MSMEVGKRTIRIEVCEEHRGLIAAAKKSKGSAANRLLYLAKKCSNCQTDFNDYVWGEETGMYDD